MTRPIPKEWLDVCDMKRVIVHWTAGSNWASDVDREHYHIMIEGDGELRKGNERIKDNLSTGDGDYAAHVRGLNTGSIGLALCGMMGASMGIQGNYPINQTQWSVAIECCAQLCEAYKWNVTERTVLFHSEVERVYGKNQRGKWDIDYLPFHPGRSSDCIHQSFRIEVGALVDEAEPTWQDEARTWAMQEGVSDGTDPEGNATREQVWLMLKRFDERGRE